MGARVRNGLSLFDGSGATRDRRGVARASEGRGEQGGASTLELNWDISKCFEHVQREQLMHLASELGYPRTALRLSLASYAWPRRLRGTAGMVTKPICSSRGIVAGSAFACYELIAYMYAATRSVLLWRHLICTRG